MAFSSLYKNIFLQDVAMQTAINKTWISKTQSHPIDFFSRTTIKKYKNEKPQNSLGLYKVRGVRRILAKGILKYQNGFFIPY